MDTIYRSEHGTAFSDPRGFVELVISKHSMFEPDEVRSIMAALIAHGIEQSPILISRINEYAVPENFNILDLSKIGGVVLSRVAVYAPSPGDHTFSHLMGQTAFKRVPYKVFSDRGPAIDWLLGGKIQDDTP